MKLVYALLSAAALFAAARPGFAAVAWDEATNGDLSNSGLTPTAVSFGIGGNTVAGSTGNANQGERDYFKFVVPDDARLTAIMVLPETFVSGSVSFIGMQAGPQVTGMTAANLIGFAHYGNDSVGTDILPQIASGGLGPGTYSVWIQETGGIIDYGFDFRITSQADVPIPAVAVALLGALLGAAGIRRLRERPT